jgi:hypothetical protein
MLLIVIFYRGYAPHLQLLSPYQQLVEAVKRISDSFSKITPEMSSDTSSDSHFVLFFFHERYIILTSASSYNMFINLSRTFLIITPVLDREGWPIVRDWTFFITPLSFTERGGPLSEIGRSSSPLCPLLRGVVPCPRLDVPHEVLYSSSSLFSSF